MESSFGIFIAIPHQLTFLCCLLIVTKLIPMLRAGTPPRPIQFPDFFRGYSRAVKIFVSFRNRRNRFWAFPRSVHTFQFALNILR
jgi:hypothetical protein